MKKCFVALIGGTVLLLGLAMLILPGPGVLVMASGVAILATEFLWARRALRKCKKVVKKVPGKFRWLRLPWKKPREEPRAPSSHRAGKRGARPTADAVV